jgi:tetratricopeptide (TPR) repeat protein
MRAHRSCHVLTLVLCFVSILLFSTNLLRAQAVDPLPTVASAPVLASALPVLSPERQGDLLMARGSYAAALQAYQLESLQSAVICNKLGIAYHHLFALEEARKHYLMAIHLNPHYAEALNNLAAVYHGQHNYKQAEKTYKQSLKYAPDSALTYKNLGTTYLSDEKYKLGAQAYQKALTLNPNVFDTSQTQPIEDSGSRAQRADVSYYLAKTYATVGNNEQALLFLRRALAAGFRDRRRLIEDKDFAALRGTPEFQQLMEQMQPGRSAHHVTG